MSLRSPGETAICPAGPVQEPRTAREAKTRKARNKDRCTWQGWGFICIPPIWGFAKHKRSIIEME
jgi:hypothetical protein